MSEEIKKMYYNVHIRFIHANHKHTSIRVKIAAEDPAAALTDIKASLSGLLLTDRNLGDKLDHPMSLYFKDLLNEKYGKVITHGCFEFAPHDVTGYIAEINEIPLYVPIQGIP